MERARFAAGLVLAIALTIGSSAFAQSRSADTAVVIATMLEAVPRGTPACGHFYVLSARRFRIDRVESGAIAEPELVLVLGCPEGRWQPGQRYRLTISRHRPAGIAGVHWSPPAPRGATIWWVTDQRAATP